MLNFNNFGLIDLTCVLVFFPVINYVIICYCALQKLAESLPVLEHSHYI